MDSGKTPEGTLIMSIPYAGGSVSPISSLNRLAVTTAKVVFSSGSDSVLLKTCRRRWLRTFENEAKLIYRH